MNYQWYPGHMTKARRMMQEDIKLIDLVIELLDARVPFSSRNPDIDKMGRDKARLILLNKSDLADEKSNEAWVAFFEAKGYCVRKINSRSGAGLKSINAAVLEACHEKIERDKRKGIKNRPVRAMVVGIPNVGKSTFINAYAGKALVIVRSTNKAGNFTVKAESDSLTGGEATVTTVSASDGSNTSMTSYRMTKHLYAPVGSSDIELPASVTASYADGTTKTCKITWGTYDKAALKTAGSFRIEGSFTDGTETVDVYITAHIYGKIKVAENYSCITKPNTIPELPKTAMTYYADGTAFEAREITWDMNGVTADTFKNIGDIVTVNGKVSAFGEKAPVAGAVTG